MKKVLVVKLRALGDSVITTALISEVARLYPQSKIHYLVSKTWAELFEGHKNIEKVWTYEKSASIFEGFNNNWGLIKELRKEKFDLVLAPHASKRTAWIAKMSGAPLKIVHNHDFNGRDWFSDKVIPRKKELASFVQRDLKCLEALGCTVSSQVHTRLTTHAAEMNWAEEYLRSKPGPHYALCLGASRPSKVWPMEYFARLAQLAAARGSVFVILGKYESRLERDFVSHLADGHRIHILNSMTLKQMAALLSKMNLVVGNDSGPRHVAAALGVRTVTLYGPQDPFECHPYDVKLHPYLFFEGLKCRENVDPSGKHFWCGIHTCIVERHKCMKEIRPTQVWELILNQNLTSSV